MTNGGGRKEADPFSVDTWRSSQQPQRPSRIPQDVRTSLFVGEDGFFHQGKGSNGNAAIPLAHQVVRDKLGEQRDQYHSEPNMNYPNSRRTKGVTAESNLIRSLSNREKRTSIDGEPRAASPTLPLNDSRRQLEYRHSTEATLPSSQKLHLEYDRDVPDDVSEASGRTSRPVVISARHYRPPMDSPQRLAARSQHKPSKHVNKEASPPSKKRRRDYDDQALAGMDYTTLREESFDLDPLRADKDSRNAVQEAQGLPEKLDKMKNSSATEQQRFFRDLPINDWEASGDWFMEQFAGLMNALRESRRDRRKVIAGFEDEIAQREEAVRRRTEAIEKRLGKMKRDGEKVMQQSMGM